MKKSLIALALATGAASSMAGMAYQERPLSRQQAQQSEARLTARNNDVQSRAAQDAIRTALIEVNALSGAAAAPEARLAAHNRLVEALALDPNRKFVLQANFPQKDDDGFWMPGARRR